MLYELVDTATNLFIHANARVPARLDAWLRLLLVTPDMHRVHHSAHWPETDSNYGAVVPWWDRLFGTYRTAGGIPGHPARSRGVPGPAGLVSRLASRAPVPGAPGAPADAFLT